MADDYKPPGASRIIPRAKVEAALRQRDREDRKGKPREMSVSEIYNTNAEAKADQPEMIGAKRLSKYKAAAKQFAADNGMTYSEFQRRAEFAMMRHPSLLPTVDDLEAEYQSLLSGSRWHPKDDREPT